MNVHEQIEDYIASQPEPKRGEMQALHDMILQVSPASKLWFLDGVKCASVDRADQIKSRMAGLIQTAFWEVRSEPFGS